MTQTQMTAYLADKIGIIKRQAKSALDELNELVPRQLKREGALRLAGLGVIEPAPNSWTLGLDRSWMIGFYEIFSGARVCGAQSRNIHCIRQAGRGQAEHWLQRVPAGQ